MSWREKSRPGGRQTQPGIWEAWKEAPYSIRYAKPYKKTWFGAVGLTAVSAGLAILAPWPFAFLIDSVLQSKSAIPGPVAHLVGTSPVTLIVFAAVATLLITGLMQGVSVLYEYITTKMDQHMTLDFRSDLFEHAQRLSFTYHDSSKTGKFIYTVNSMATSAGNIVLAFPPMAQALFTLVGMFVVTFHIDPVLALLAMSITPPVYYALGHYNRRVLPAVREVAGREMEALSIVHEALMMLRTVVAFGRERYEHSRYRTQAERVVRARVEVTVRQTLFSLAVETLTAAGTALVMGVGAYRVLSGHMTVGDLTVVLAYIAAIYSPVQQISGTLGHLQVDLYHLHRCKSLLETDPEVNEAETPVQIARAAGRIRYEHVNFAYQGRTNTLLDVDFSIPAGQRIAVLGPTGAGKTTLISLLLRYHDPKGGRILLDGVDIRKLSLKSLRDQIAVVHQEPVLFSGTIADNIRYGRLEASMREVVEAAKAASAHEFIMRLPNKYETVLGERGAQLSGGERQRISIARAFVRNAPILVLDEPTSSIDSKTEAGILDALERLMKGRTTIFIAHRLSTIRTARLILVLNEGRLVEQGTHRELLTLGGLYSQLWNAQSGSRLEPTNVGTNQAEGLRITELARALGAGSDPERDAARDELTRCDREELIVWSRDAVRSGSVDEATAAARVAETLGLSDIAVDIVERAAILPPENRAPLVSAFRSFPFDPSSLESILLALEPSRRGQAIDFLLGVLGPEVVPELDLLENEGPPAIRLAVREALRRSGEGSSPEADSSSKKAGGPVDAQTAATHPVSPLAAPEQEPVLTTEGPLLRSRPRLVVFGMMTKMPVAGVVWQTIQYLVGFRELGYLVTYVEAHGRTPTMFMDEPDDDGWARAARFLAGVMDRFGFANEWAYQAHDAGRHFGMDESELQRRFASADLLINLHGGMLPLPAHIQTGRLIYLETDPVEVQVQLAEGRRDTIEYLKAHAAHFSFGENLGAPDCKVPAVGQFTFLATRQPIVMKLWRPDSDRRDAALTTVGNWEQRWRQVRVGDEVYTWSKHHEFLKFLDLPSRTPQLLELALSSSSINQEHRALLQRNGWLYRDALTFSLDLNAYREYLTASRGEFTVAKDQNVRLRSGWFSDRSAAYLAAGRPVITQETGFSNVLPTKAGLFAFTSLDEVVSSIEAINADYRRHGAAAREIAREFFAHDVVLKRLLTECGVDRAGGSSRPFNQQTPTAIPRDLALTPLSRRPLRLREATARQVGALPVPTAGQLRAVPHQGQPPSASIVMVSFDGLLLTKLCLMSVLSNTDVSYELIVIDNASSDGSPEFLQKVADQNHHVRLVKNAENLGFAAAVNQGVAMSRGEFIVVLNNDTIVSPGWLPHLIEHLREPTVGLVGAVTNRSGTAAEIPTDYATYEAFVQTAVTRARERGGECFDIDTAAMFCAAFRRADFDEIGPLDETYGLGLFEDDDYCMRVRQHGYRVICAEDVLVHHFGEGAFGTLVPTGEHGRLFEANRLRFERRWGSWNGHARRNDDSYHELVSRVRNIVNRTLPASATVLVLSKGDDALLDLGGRRVWHFPQTGDNVYAGHYPATSEEAIAQLEQLRARGAEYLVLPATGFWWLEHYAAFADHLSGCYPVVRVPQTCEVYGLAEDQVPGLVGTLSVSGGGGP
jgi:ATP-binding cassette, subfamily B, bacterial